MSMRVTLWPRDSSASATPPPLISDTSRSADQPPIRTATCHGPRLIRAYPRVESPIAVRCRSCPRSEEHTSELQSLMRISYAVFCLKNKKKTQTKVTTKHGIIQTHT